MMITDKMSGFNGYFKTVNPGRKDEVFVLPKRDSYLFLRGFKKYHNNVA